MRSGSLTELCWHSEPPYYGKLSYRAHHARYWTENWQDAHAEGFEGAQLAHIALLELVLVQRPVTVSALVPNRAVLCAHQASGRRGFFRGVLQVMRRAPRDERGTHNDRDAARYTFKAPVCKQSTSPMQSCQGAHSLRRSALASGSSKVNEMSLEACQAVGSTRKGCKRT